MIIQAQRSFLSRPTLQQFVRFVSVGVICTLVDVFAFLVMRGVLGVDTLAANTLSYSLGIIVSFGLNRTWTFAATGQPGVALQFMRFLVVSLSALALNTLVVIGGEALLSTIHLISQADYLLAKAAATGVGLFWNFFANRSWTFCEDAQ